MNAPTTIEAFFALPEGGGFSTEERLIDGVMRRCAIAPDLAAFCCEVDAIMFCMDAQGVRWDLARYSDGRWCRRRA